MYLELNESMPGGQAGPGKQSACRKLKPVIHKERGTGPILTLKLTNQKYPTNSHITI